MGEAGEHQDTEKKFLDRRSVLRAAGIGTAAATFSLGAGGRPARAAVVPRTRRGSAGNLPLVGGEEFPIGLYWPPPPFQTTQQRYREIADAGFNFIIAGNYLADRYIQDYACRIADDTGIAMLLHHEPRLWAMTHILGITENGSKPLTVSTDEARTLLTQVLDTYKGHSSFAGINFFDEPGLFNRVPTVGRAFSVFRELTDERLPYTNLARGTSSNENRLRDFLDLVDPPLISFDHYPLFTDSIDRTWFADWASVRRIGLEYDLPTWTYILSVPHLNYRAPNTAEMLWQVNVSLAYGCKGIQYFTYWTPDPARGAGFAQGAGALLTVDGKRTERYDGAKWINNQWLSRVGKQLKPLRSSALGIANPPGDPPAGLPRFRPNEYVKQAPGDPVIVSRFTDPGNPAYQWVFVVNYSLDRKATARIRFGSKVRGNGVYHFDARTDRYVQAAGHGKHLDVTLDAGAASLYRLTVTE
ncbi:MAG: hypothetical protein ACRDMV_08305 [Streptosporangiales bacterium]